MKRVWSLSAVFNLPACISCLQPCDLHQRCLPLSVGLFFCCGRYLSNHTLAQSFCIHISVLTGTYTQHHDSHCFCHCTLRSESIINLLTAVLRVLFYYSTSKRCFFLVSPPGYILFYTCNVKLLPVLNSV
jgi:hypothetical protein